VGSVLGLGMGMIAPTARQVETSAHFIQGLTLQYQFHKLHLSVSNGREFCVTYPHSYYFFCQICKNPFLLAFCTRAKHKKKKTTKNTSVSFGFRWATELDAMLLPCFLRPIICKLKNYCLHLIRMRIRGVYAIRRIRIRRLRIRHRGTAV